MKTEISKNWHRVDNDNTQEVHLSDGKKFRVAKLYDWDTCEHAKFRGQGQWRVEVFNSEIDDWDWIETYSPMWWAKENALTWGNVNPEGIWK